MLRSVGSKRHTDSSGNGECDILASCKNFVLFFFFCSQVFKYAHFSNGYGPIWQDNLQCVGNETDIGDCPSNGWGNTDCGHGEDAGVSCGQPLILIRSTCT